MAEQITIQITTENAAFDDEPTAEVCRILRALLNRWENGELIADRPVMESNGNRCGRVTVRKLRGTDRE